MTRRLDRLLVMLALLAAWQGANALFGAFWLSSPLAVAKDAWTRLGDGELPLHAAFTLAEAVAGAALGGGIGIVLPFVLRLRPRLLAVLDPFLAGGYGAPKLAFAPMFVLWFGIGSLSKIMLVAFTVFFITYFATLAGVRFTDPGLLRMARIAGASERQLLWRIVLPSALPTVFTGLRIAVPYAVSAALIAELISADRGLGFLVQSGAMDFDTTAVFTGVTAATLLVLALNAAVNVLERRLRGQTRHRVTIEEAAG